MGFDFASGFGRLDAVASSLPEPGGTVELIAGAAGLLGIASWRARKDPDGPKNPARSYAV